MSSYESTVRRFTEFVCVSHSDYFLQFLNILAKRSAILGHLWHYLLGGGDNDIKADCLIEIPDHLLLLLKHFLPIFGHIVWQGRGGTQCHNN